MLTLYIPDRIFTRYCYVCGWQQLNLTSVKVSFLLSRPSFWFSWFFVRNWKFYSLICMYMLLHLLQLASIRCAALIHYTSFLWFGKGYSSCTNTEVAALSPPPPHPSSLSSRWSLTRPNCGETESCVQIGRHASYVIVFPVANSWEVRGDKLVTFYGSP
jgi:hypothetical protein